MYAGCRVINGTFNAAYNKEAGTKTTTIDLTSNLSAYVSSTIRAHIIFILQGNISGNPTFICKYYNGNSTTQTSKTTKLGGSGYSGVEGGVVFSWTATEANISKNGKITYGLTIPSTYTGTIGMRYTLLVFRTKYGHTVD